MPPSSLRAVRLPAAEGPALYREVLAGLPLFWGDRDLRAVHAPVWLRQFAGDAVVVRDGDPLVGYLLGVLTADGLAYVNAVATRLDRRGAGVGRLLYSSFLTSAAGRGGHRVEAVTRPGNTGSRAFHARLGFEERSVPDYAGPGEDRVLLFRQFAAPPG